MNRSPNTENQQANVGIEPYIITNGLDMYRTFHPTATEYVFLSAHGTFSRIGHMIGHKTSNSKFKQTEIIPGVFSDHNVMKLEINTEKKVDRLTNMWKLNNILLNNQQINYKRNKKLP